ncbi:hypothetical protein AN639_10740 [Candidatus Epulonipiscium fishelsonii]|uniref:Uncharacterized protein n=1 Tax=Candidatus Epulonipiscium fishelsonii TaxID=77094 RepID=A0ACC8XFC7_9FIRM|nr:hypothetical protein AN396_00495 [Epulopiscium sp. SCG-B11WGA-EpuloA1]ONI43280.1 hypothetical protein AN639_10740 [Epulopiscium sp. SCG-B05WGA-EpuloA1]
MTQFISVSLTIFYALMGFLMLFIAYKSFITIDDNKKFGTALFWILMAIPFIAGEYIPKNIIGLLLILSSCLTVSKQVVFAKYEAPSEEFALASSEKLGNKIFLPSLVLAIVALIVATVWAKVPGASYFAIAAAGIVALIAAFALTKAKPIVAVNDSARLLQQMGPSSMLPQLLVALGALFTTAGVGDVISQLISGIIPADSRLMGVIAYCIGMAVFTMIMGNAFAAFAVITAGIGIPFVLSHGGNPAIIGAFALTAGYCGTLMTPMAANFNIVPAALLEMKKQYDVIKYQFPVAITLLIAHIVCMYLFGF